jgi:hypothetical protein
MPVILSRRTLLVAAPSLAIRPALGQERPDRLTTYERETGGRIGLYAENLSTGLKISWRAEERYVMCSTFKASLAAFVLARIDRGEDRLQDIVGYGSEDLLDYAPVARQNLAKGAMSVEEMCKGAVEFSDNTCANLLAGKGRRSSRPDGVLALDGRCGHAPRPQRAGAEPFAAGQSGRHHDARCHGRQFAELSARRGIVARFTRPPHPMDDRLQDRRQPLARRPAQEPATRPATMARTRPVTSRSRGPRREGRS